MNFLPHTEILKGAADAIDEGLGFSFLRFGHCEARLAGFETVFDKTAVLSSIRMQWGYKDYNTEALRQFSKMIRDAFRNANLVGLHDPRKPSSNPDLAAVERKAFLVAQSLELLSKPLTLATAQYPLGLDPGFYEFLRSRHVVVITGRYVADGLQARIGGLTTLTHIPLTPEWRKMPANRKIREPHYPVSYHRVRDTMQRICRPGTVVLVGGGLIGKLFCAEAKRLGAIAFDLGALFDAWAGLKTRGGGFPEGLVLSQPVQTL